MKRLRDEASRPRQARRRHPGTPHALDHRHRQRPRHPLGDQPGDDRGAARAAEEAEGSDRVSTSAARGFPFVVAAPSGHRQDHGLPRGGRPRPAARVLGLAHHAAARAPASATASTTTSWTPPASSGWSRRARSSSGRSTTAIATARAGARIEEPLARGPRRAARDRGAGRAPGARAAARRALRVPAAAVAWTCCASASRRAARTAPRRSRAASSSRGASSRRGSASTTRS